MHITQFIANKCITLIKLNIHKKQTFPIPTLENFKKLSN